MSWQPNRRQLLALGGAAATTSVLPMPSIAQPAAVDRIRIGAVFPARSGLTRVRTSLSDFIGSGGRYGSLMANERIGDVAAQQGIDLVVLQSNAPSAEAAIRACERLVEAEEVDALVGGVGPGQFEAIAGVAIAAGIPFFNCGTSSGVLRETMCDRHIFHVEASDAMYLDAMVAWSASQGSRRWFVLHEDNERGRAMQRRVLTSVARHGEGGEVVGAAGAIVEQPFYFEEMDQAARAGADTVLVLLSAVDQIAFLAQMETGQLDVLAVPFPTAIAQTRDYLAALRLSTPNTNPDHRIQLWETTLTEHGADAFNERYTSRFSEVVDPTGWTSYSAVKMYFEAAVAAGSTEPDAIISYLESPEAVFDVLKGPGTSFRPWDHQLRQPLYVVEVDQEAEWVPSRLGTRIGIADYEETLPSADGDLDPVARLDLFGDGPDDTTCSL